jgi:hypothetical protein
MPIPQQLCSPVLCGGLNAATELVLVYAKRVMVAASCARVAGGQPRADGATSDSVAYPAA